MSLKSPNSHSDFYTEHRCTGTMNLNLRKVRILQILRNVSANGNGPWVQVINWLKLGFNCPLVQLIPSKEHLNTFKRWSDIKESAPVPGELIKIRRLEGFWLTLAHFWSRLFGYRYWVIECFFFENRYSVDQFITWKKGPFRKCGCMATERSLPRFFWFHSSRTLLQYSACKLEKIASIRHIHRWKN